MCEYTKLTIECQSLWEADRSDLPQALGERVDRDFAPFGWDMLSVARRKLRAEEVDATHDPAVEDEMERAFDTWTTASAELNETNRAIQQLERMIPNQPTEFEARERQLGDLRAKQVALRGKLEPTPQRFSRRNQAIYEEVERRQAAGERSVMKQVAKSHSVSPKTVLNIVADLRGQRGESRTRNRK